MTAEDTIGETAIREEGDVVTPYTEQEPTTVTARRYRNSDYFRDDMLKCSDVVEEFQSVKNLVNNLQAFSLQSKFAFVTESVRCK